MEWSELAEYRHHDNSIKHYNRSTQHYRSLEEKIDKLIGSQTSESLRKEQEKRLQDWLYDFSLDLNKINDLYSEVPSQAYCVIL